MMPHERTAELVQLIRRFQAGGLTDERRVALAVRAASATHLMRLDQDDELFVIEVAKLSREVADGLHPDPPRPGIGSAAWVGGHLR
jgi:hypothetical protein